MIYWRVKKSPSSALKHSKINKAEITRLLMKKILCFVFLALMPSLAIAEIIDISNEEKTFGEWKVFCESDEMMNIAHCKIASKFYDNSSVVTIQPTAKFANQFFIIIPQILNGSFVKIRVDQNDLVLSRSISAKDFGLIGLSDDQKNILFSQMKNGDFMFMRFSVKSSDKELTARLNLKDFRDALSYYNSRVSK